MLARDKSKAIPVRPPSRRPQGDGSAVMTSRGRGGGLQLQIAIGVPGQLGPAVAKLLAALGVKAGRT